GTFLTDNWLFFSGLAYHVDEKGLIQTGFHTINGVRYYLPADGRIVPGWHTVGTDTFYIQANGSLAVSAVIDGKTIGADGKVTGTAPVAQETVQAAVPVTAFQSTIQQIIDQITTPQMTPEQKLLACYVWVMDAITYQRSYDTPAGDWTKAYAAEAYSTGKGNCYRYAAAFAYLAKGLGYEARVCTGGIQSVRGGLTPHGWVEINFGGTWLLFDPDMQDTRRGTNYFAVTYEAFPVKPLVKETDWPVTF
ncbi:MAG: hypothetical protein J5973_06075, partial [Eubacterium sp.]|nr:hypothetical protein [Eubacterium sp.]